MAIEKRQYQKVVKTNDGFSNVVKGVGGDKDLLSGSYYSQQLRTFIWKEMNDLYSTNWIAAKAINIPVDDAFKHKRLLECEDAEILKEFEDECEYLEIDEKIQTALKWAGCFGGAVMIIVSDDDTMDQPLNLNNFKQGYLKNIAVLDRWDVHPMGLQIMNPLSKDYLEPEYYTLSRQGGKIHKSRVIKFNGENTTNYNKQLMQGFGISQFEKLYTSITNATMSPDLMVNLVSQSNLDVYGVEGLKESLADNEDDLLIKRFRMVQMAKSIFNGVLIDSNDNYQNIAKNFSGLSDINKQFFEIVCGAVDVPFSRFMGQSVTGLAQTNDGDLENYYNKVKSVKKQADRAYKLLDKIAMLNKFGNLYDISHTYKSLFELSDMEKAELRNKQANTDSLYIDRGIITDMDVKSRLAQDELYPSITPESVEEEKKLLSEYSNVI